VREPERVNQIPSTCKVYNEIEHFNSAITLFTKEKNKNTIKTAMAPSDQNAYYIVSRMVGLVGSGFASGAILSTAYFAMPGILHPTITAAERVKTFKQMSSRSTFWLTRIVAPAAVAYIYVAFTAPHSVSSDEGFVGAKSLLGLAGTCMAFVVPYSWLKMNGPAKRLIAVGKSQEIDDEKDLGVQVADEGMVERDLVAWGKGDKVRGWMVLTAFLLGSFVEVCYL
jgi:hypothetical protein